MRIAINTRFLLKDRLEGIGRVSYELSRRLALAHPEDEFLFLFDRPYDPSFVFSDNVTPKVVHPPARHPFLWYLWFEWGIPSVLKKWKADIFLSPDSYCSLSATCKTLMITHDIAHLQHPDDIPFLVRNYYQYFVPRYLQRADRITTVSQFVKEDIINQYQIAAGKIEVIHNACNAIFQPLDQATQAAVKEEYADGQAYFFYAGAVHPRKNVDGLIRAFSLFKQASQAPTKLLIGGRWAWQTGAVKEAYDACPFREDIRFLGFISEEALARIMASAYAVTYVSHFEGFGLPVLEAMHCDVPVITSDTTSLPEVAGEAALLVNPKSWEAIAGAMQTIWENKELREELVRRGQLQRRQFDWDRSAEQLYQLLQSMLTPT